jgi:hypothetical protein
VEKDLREKMVKRWRQKAVDREERASVIKAAKAKRAVGSRSSSKLPEQIVRGVMLTRQRRHFRNSIQCDLRLPYADGCCMTIL